MVLQSSRYSHPNATPGALVKYGLAPAAVLLVWIGRYYVEPILGGASPLLPFTFSVTVAAYFGGLWSGLSAAVLGSIAGGYFLAGTSLNVGSLFSLGMFFAVSSLISVVFEHLRRERKRASENEERFRLLVEGAWLTSIFALDTDGRITAWNAGAERLTGYSLELVSGRYVELLYTPDDRGRRIVQAALSSAAELGSFTWEGWLMRRNGEKFWAEVSTTALRSADGTLRGFSQVTRDLTESKRQEMALQESEQAMRALMESAAQGIVAVNREGRIVLVNAMAEQLFGYSREELLSSYVEMLMPRRYSDGHIAQREGYFDTPRNRPMGMGQPLSACRKDGSEFPVEISLSSVQTRQGQLAVSFITDISSRAAAERERETLTREIAEERARLRSVLEQMPVGVILAEAPGPKIVLHNREAERILGHEIGSAPNYPLVGPVDTGGVKPESTQFPYFLSLNTGQTVEQEEIRYRKGDNKTTTLSVSTSPIRDSEGKIVASVATFTDVSGRKKAEAERELLLGETRTLNRFLEMSNEDLRQFAYAASHDLQEPLRMVTSYTQLLERRYGNAFGEDGRQFIEYAVTGALRIENLLRALRDYWQVSELTGVEPVWTECHTVLARALQNVQEAVRETQGTITHDPLPRVLAAETPLLQLFQNLIGNALKYRHPDRRPAVHVSATKEDGEWIFSVRDNGIGIDPQYARQVFGIFKRLNGYRYSGAGMGLSICQKIVERFGGRIWVESELGNGATFFFTVPADGRKSALRASENHDTSAAPAAGSHR